MTWDNGRSPIRMIAVDLDGTLLNSRQEVSPANQQALAAAAGRGIHILIVTGRRFHSALQFLRHIPCPVAVISSNGARIADASGEVRQRRFLPREIAREILRAAPEYRSYAVVIFDTPERGQVTMQDDAVPQGPLGWYLRNAPRALAQVSDLEAALLTEPIQVMFGGSPEKIEPLEPLLRACPVAAAVHLTWTRYLSRNTSLLDVMNRGVSKGAALEHWARHCKIDASEVMAIGDNFNDLEMLHFAGWPVLMGNCCDGLQDHGWQQTLSNDEHGVAAAIRRYVLT